MRFSFFKQALRELAKRIEQAFSNQEERKQRETALAELKKARHENRRIGDLCDQREQFHQLIKMATVPGVKETMEKALRKIEDELQTLYPNAISVEKNVPTDLGFIEEIHFFVDEESKVSIVLPIDVAMFERIEKGETSPATDRIMRFVWDMIKKLGLKHTDGEFRLDGERCLFATAFSADDMAVLDSGFSVSIASASALQFKFSALPTEIQEVLA